MEHVRTTVRQLMERARAHCMRKRVLEPTAFDFDDIPDIADFRKAVERYRVDTAYFNSSYDLKQHARADWTGALPVLREFAQRFYKVLRKDGFPVYAHTVYRSPELQEQLMRSGNSTLRSGPHQRGCAVDFVHVHHHWSLNENAWRYLGQVGEHIARQNAFPIEWGGRWRSFPDPAHWQVKGWRKYDHVLAHSHPLVLHPASCAGASMMPREARHV